MDADPRAGTDHRESLLRQGPGEAPLMLPYIIAGIVALFVTLYLFAALLFPERF
jgi:K+-transporting ATPase KdpF subunit